MTFCVRSSVKKVLVWFKFLTVSSQASENVTARAKSGPNFLMLFIAVIQLLNFQKYSVFSRNRILRPIRAKCDANRLRDGYETVAIDKKKEIDAFLQKRQLCQSATSVQCRA
jgi:hypothetical protein